jgi:hypothetical protein
MMLRTLQCLILVSAVYTISAGADGVRDALPGPGESIVLRGIKVTLLGAKRLSHDEYRRASGTLYGGWAGGGVRLAFLVENRAGAPTMPALGEVRVLFDSQQYNAVTNSSSRQPFAPFMVVHEPEPFLATPFGRGLREGVRTMESRPSLGVLDVFIRGRALPARSDGVVEIEQGETHRPDVDGRLRALNRSEIGSSWTWFRFRLPPL